MLPDEVQDSSSLPESQKHGYRAVAEILLHAYQSRYPATLSRVVKRFDTFPFIELSQLGIIKEVKPKAPPPSPTRSLLSPGGLSLSGRGDSIRTPRFALPGTPTSPGQMALPPPWFHGVLGKEAAGALLSVDMEGRFLVRKRPGRGDYALAVVYNGNVTHHAISRAQVSSSHSLFQTNLLYFSDMYYLLQDGILEVNNARLGNIRTLEELVELLRRPDHPEWPVQLSDFVPWEGCPDELIEREKTGADLPSSNEKKTKGKKEGGDSATLNSQHSSTMSSNKQRGETSQTGKMKKKKKNRDDTLNSKHSDASQKTDTTLDSRQSNGKKKGSRDSKPKSSAPRSSWSSQMSRDEATAHLNVKTIISFVSLNLYFLMYHIFHFLTVEGADFHSLELLHHHLRYSLYSDLLELTRAIL